MTVIIIQKGESAESNTTNEEHEAMKKLESDEGITILYAGERNTIVVLDSKDYEKKARKLLEQPSFKKVKKDPFAQNERKVDDCMKKLAKTVPRSSDTFKISGLLQQYKTSAAFKIHKKVIH